MSAYDSNGYEQIAEHFLLARNPSIGPAVVRRWSKSLPAGATILDVGCGSGAPISQTLLQEGFTVYGIDASPTLVSRFRKQFPDAPVECSPIEDSLFFRRTFDAVVCWGLMFVLPVASQRILIEKVARALHPDGKFLFTATKELCTWSDSLTHLPSTSLGHDAYQQELTAHGLALVGNDQDEGGNYYYFAAKTSE